ncbi:MAG TPA: hypothetical protein VH500_04475 [Nitrososphaeraceae archaeon]
MSDLDQSRSDKIVYFGVTNLLENNRLIGAVDIWRSVISKELFCEEKRLGILDIGEKIGMPNIPKNKKWTVVVSRDRIGKDKWNLVTLDKDGEARFTDQLDERDVTVQVKDFKVVDKGWWSFLIERNVNRNVDISKEGNAK